MMQLLWKQFDSFLIKLPYDTAFSLIGLYPKGKRANVPTKNSENVYSSIVCNRWKVETLHHLMSGLNGMWGNDTMENFLGVKRITSKLMLQCRWILQVVPQTFDFIFCEISNVGKYRHSGCCRPVIFNSGIWSWERLQKFVNILKPLLCSL